MLIRNEQAKDYFAISELLKVAFAEDPHSDHQEHLLVERLRKSSAYSPELALVAEWNEKVVGFIMLTLLLIKGEKTNWPALALAPVAVQPELQRKGIGATLIKAAHIKAKSLGHQIVVLVGHAEYYPRFGYKRTDEYKVKLPFEVPAENAMILELISGSLAEVDGMVIYPDAFF